MPEIIGENPTNSANEHFDESSINANNVSSNISFSVLYCIILYDYI